MKNQKLYILITIVITLCIHTSCASSETPEPKLPAITTEMIASALPEADLLFKQRENISKLREAVSVLAKVRTPNQKNFEVEWKFAKFNYFLGRQSPDEKEADAAFTKGRDAGKIAYGLAPDKPDGYFWYGANLGELARKNMLTVGLRSLDDIKSSMNKVIELQPTYQNSSAYDALAQLELETRLYSGKAETAAELLEKALETEKDNTNIHLHLAEAYLALKKDTDARKQLNHLLQMKPNPDFMIEYKECVEKAKKMLETKF